MVANMKVGNMDAFCVGEPWNEQLVNQDIGFTACTTGEIWFKHPEKALGMRAEWVDKYPNAARALTMAVLEAQMWCEKTGWNWCLRTDRGFAIAYPEPSPWCASIPKPQNAAGLARLSSAAKQWIFE